MEVKEIKISLEKTLHILKTSLSSNKPYHAQWMLTGRCNYRCEGCSVWRQKEILPEASTDEVIAGLNVLRKLGVTEVVLTGGNPLLREDIGEIIDYASRFFMTTIYDNGSLAVKKIDALRKVDFVAISLDSLDYKKFDYIRGVDGACRTAVKAVETLQSEGVSVGVSPTISQLNLHEVLNLTKYFIERKIPVWYCLYGYDSPTTDQLFKIGNQAGQFEIRDSKAMVDLCSELTKLKKKHEGIYITTKTLRALEDFFSTGKRTWRCKALQSFFMIDPSGRVAGCHRNEPVAKVWELLEVWGTSRLAALREKYSRCSQCTYLCYIFYSLHGDALSNMNIVFDQWRNLFTFIS